MSATIEADLGHIRGVSDSVRAALAHARVDNVIGNELRMLPGLDVIVQDVVAHATAASDAIGLITAAVDLASAASAAQAGSVSTSPVNDAGLKAGIAKLGTAAAVGPLIDKIEKLLNDPAIRAKLKKAAADRGLTGGIDEARGALKSITPNTVAVSGQIRGVIANIQSHKALAGSPAAKASLAQAEANLQTILAGFGKDVLRFVAVVDTAIGATFS